MLQVMPGFPDYQFVVAGVSTFSPEFYAQFTQGTNIKILYEQTYDLLSHAEAALVTSGTATLETALFNVPQIVCYKTSAISYAIGKMVIKVKYISLVNLIADKEVVKELIQDELFWLRIMAEHKLPVNLHTLMRDALLTYEGSDAAKKFTHASKAPSEIANFFRERLEFYLRDAKGFAFDVVNAVLAAGSDNVVDVLARAEAVAKVRPSEDFEAISVAFKRIKNILRQATEAGKWNPAEAAGLVLGNGEPAEMELLKQAADSGEKVQALKAEQRYDEALAEVAREHACHLVGAVKRTPYDKRPVGPMPKAAD
jgi:hypothetical protein